MAAAEDQAGPRSATNSANDSVVDVFGIGFISKCFRSASDLTEALSDAMHQVLLSDIMDELPPDTRGSVRAGACVNTYRAASQISTLASEALRTGLQRKVLDFVRGRDWLHKCLCTPPPPSANRSSIPDELARLRANPAKPELRKFLREELQPADENLDTDHLRGCLPNTRLHVLDDLHAAIHKATQEAGSNLIWLRGVVGSGKTSVMSSAAKDLLGSIRTGEFYCSRGDAARSDARRILPTIACKLGTANGDVGTALEQALLTCPKKVTAPAEQLRLLILDPLRQATAGATVVFIDALDECGNGNESEQLLDALVSPPQEVGHVVFIVSSRPERVIVEKLHGNFPTIDLDDIRYRNDTCGDVDFYLREHLPEPVLRPLLAKVRESPTYEEAIDKLAKIADGYFVVASFTLATLRKGVGRQTFLSRSLSHGRLSDRTASLFSQFSLALDAAFAEPVWAEDELSAAVHTVLAALCCAWEPLNSSTIAGLGDLDEDLVEDVLTALAPLLAFSANKYSFFHASVADFLQSKSANQYFVDAPALHGHFVSSCLRILDNQLDFNASQIHETGTRFAECQVQPIASPLVYASIYWTDHLVASSLSLSTVGGEVVSFLDAKFLFWLEILSRYRRVHSNGIGGLDRVVRFMGSNVTDYVRDCQRCVSLWASELAKHPAAAYFTVFPWLPRPFRDELGGKMPWISTASPRALIGAPERWPDTISIWNAGQSLQSIAYSHDGTMIVSAVYDWTVRIWDVRAGDLRGQPLRGHTDVVSSVAFSPDDSMLVSGADDTTIRLWNVKDGRPRGEPLRGHEDWITSVAFNPAGSIVASGSYDRTVRLWNVKDRILHCQPLRGHSSKVFSVAFSPNGSTLASGSDDGTIQLWLVGDGAHHLGPLRGHDKAIRSIVFSPNGSTLASGSYDTTIRLWNVGEGTPLGQPMRGHTGWVSSIAFNHDASIIASGSYDGTLRLWCVKDGRGLVDFFHGHTDRSIQSVAFSPDGSNVASGSVGGAIRLWSVQNESPRRDAVDDIPTEVATVVFSSDGSIIATGSDDGTICLLNATTGLPYGMPLRGHSEQIFAITFSADSSIVASGSYDKTIRLWDFCTQVQRGEPLCEPDSIFSSLVLSHDGSTLASGSYDGVIQLWNTNDGSPRGPRIHAHAHEVVLLAFSTDGSFVVSSSADDTIRIWNSASGTLHAEPLREFNNLVSSIALSPDGAFVAFGRFDGPIHVHNVKDGTQHGQALRGHGGAILSLDFLGNSSKLVSLSSRELVQWDFSNEASTPALSSPAQGYATVFRHLPRDYQAIAYSSITRTLAGTFGGDRRLFAISLPSEDPWRVRTSIGGKTLCQLHDV